MFGHPKQMFKLMDKKLIKILRLKFAYLVQGSHRLEKYLILEGFLEKSLNINLP